MKRYWSAFMMLVIFNSGYGQVLQPMPPPGYNSAVACTRDLTDAATCMVNQAALAEISKLSFAVYSEEKFGLKELSGASTAVAFPGAGGGIGIAACLSGTAYSQSAFGVAYGKALGGNIRLGAQLNYNLVHVQGYGNTGAVGFELGTIIKATDKLYTGIHVCNPVGGRFRGEAGEKMAAVYTMALGYDASAAVRMSLQVIKTEGQPADVLVALHYSFSSQFFLRAGLATSSGSSFAGFSLQWQHIRIDMVGSYHLQLGFTPGLQLIIPVQKSAE